ncbi:hypothetical protein J2X65_004261 [Ancylobacter sp. 3268]|uniref:hypothetical protein n=1 Tax=Ancylobacter sp. 3268 TaxID=2817752 RepID=UPI0028550327|nr:hypothetical protein [Ancylobacter sp. 3268]MDR6954885.1 hypothetical protein [Ancylobacter sp. 3268]
MGEHQNDVTVPKGRRPLAKRPRISAAMRRAVDAFLSGEAPTQKAAAELAGLSREHFNREYQKAHIQALVRQRSAEMFSALLPRAVRALAEVLDGDNRAAQLNGAVVVLKQTGLISPDNPAVSLTLQVPGYIIDLSGGSGGSAARVIEGTAVEPPAGGQDDDADGDPR